jgi:hypothetical protein
MPKRRDIFVCAAASLVLPAYGARATSTTPGQGPGPDVAALKRAAATFPQPVRVGDLVGRDLLAPVEAQNVLGRVANPPVLRQPDGSLVMAIDRGGILGFGATRVTVPLPDLALSGYVVILVGLTTEMLNALPASPADPADALPPASIIRMGIVGPFH